MNLVHKIETWGNTHHPIVLDPVRVALGIFLVFKGASFMNNAPGLHSLIVSQTAVALPYGFLMALVYIAAFIHMVGGIMVTFGVSTRLAALAQIPFVLGGVILANSVDLPVNTQLGIAVVALVLLVLFSVIGSGKIVYRKNNGKPKQLTQFHSL